MKYIIYDLTGKIIQHGECPPQFFDMQAQSGLFILEGECNDSTQYVDVATKTVVNKPPLGATINKTSVTANGTDSCLISGLPNPTTVLCEGKSYTVIDGTFQASFTLAGTYVIQLSAPNKLPQSFTVTAS